MQVDEGIRFRLGISDGYGAGKAFICLDRYGARCRATTGREPWLKPMASSRPVARKPNDYRGIAGGTREEQGMRMAGIEGVKWCSGSC